MFRRKFPMVATTAVLSSSIVFAASYQQVAAQPASNGFWASFVAGAGRELGSLLAKALIESFSKKDVAPDAAQATAISPGVDSDVRDFLQTFIRAANDCNLDVLIPMYGDYVNYYDSGTVNRGFIKKDKEHYCNRWDRVETSLTKTIDQQAAPDDTVVFLYEISYRVYSRKRNQGVFGNARNSIAIKRFASSLKVIGERQTVISRNKF